MKERERGEDVERGKLGRRKGKRKKKMEVYKKKERERLNHTHKGRKSGKRLHLQFGHCSHDQVMKVWTKPGKIKRTI